MKKFISFLVLVSFFVSAYCFAKNEVQNADVNVESKKLNVIYDGQSYEGMNLYDISGSSFFSVRELAAFYQARLE